MPIDLAAAERFVLANARLLDRHRFAALRGTGSPERTLEALRPYRNADGGFGHALEPDVRSPDSEPTAALVALEVLLETGLVAGAPTQVGRPADGGPPAPAGRDADGDAMVDGVADWVAGITGPDGGVPFVGPTTADHPRGPWMVPSPGGSHLTFALAAALIEAGRPGPWLDAATAWCWGRLSRPAELPAYSVKFALGFLDRTPETDRAEEAVAGLRGRLAPDGSLPVEGGVEGEHLTPLALAPRPGARSRALFTDEQIGRGLDDLEAEQQDDGGWDFGWLHWSPGQSSEWRGSVTIGAVSTLAAHGRVDL